MAIQLFSNDIVPLRGILESCQKTGGLGQSLNWKFVSEKNSCWFRLLISRRVPCGSGFNWSPSPLPPNTHIHTICFPVDWYGLKFSNLDIIITILSQSVSSFLQSLFPTYNVHCMWRLGSAWRLVIYPGGERVNWKGGVLISTFRSFVTPWWRGICHLWSDCHEGFKKHDPRVRSSLFMSHQKQHFSWHISLISCSFTIHIVIFGMPSEISLLVTIMLGL